MSNYKPAKRPPSMRWLHDWRNDITAMKVAETDDISQYEPRDFLMAQQFNRSNTVDPLTKLLLSQDVTAALTKPYQKLLLRGSEGDARETLKNFIADACWICNPIVNAHVDAHRISRSDHVSGLEGLRKSCLKLADQMGELMPSSALSMTYLQKRMTSGNPKNFISQRPRGWTTALISKETRLPFLLECFASEIMEQAGMVQNAIDVQRQTGGKLSAQYLAIDSLCRASTKLSTAVRQAPLFDLVSQVVGVLMGTTPPPVDTLRKRHKMTKKKKTEP